MADVMRFPNRKTFHDVDQEIDNCGFAAFSIWHRGNEEEARACWRGMSPAMRQPWLDTGAAVVGTYEGINEL